jgi:hypothetical protein
VKKIVCPRCKLPYEGINQCEYCGLVFDKKTKLKGKKFKSKESKREKTTARTQPSTIGPRILMFLAVIAALGFVLVTYVPL